MGWFTKIVEVEKVVEKIVEKTVEVEKVVERPVPGEASEVRLYHAYSECPDFSYGVISYRRDEFGFYLSCADAFKAHPGVQSSRKDWHPHWFRVFRGRGANSCHRHQAQAHEGQGGDRMKPKRLFLESPKHSDSYVRVYIDEDTGHLEMKLADCDRRIWWSFGKPGDKRAIRKITVVKAIIDEVHGHLTKAGSA